MKYILFLIPFLLQAVTINGYLFDKVLQTPIVHAQIIDRNHTVYSDSEGKFSIDSDDYLLHVKKIGYKPYAYNLSSDEVSDTLYLEPIKVKALYLNFWAARKNSKTIQRIFDIIDTTEVNAIVIDVKNEAGNTSYKTSVPRAALIGAHYRRGIKDIDSFIQRLKERNIYIIARVVVFKDELLVSKHPEFALKRIDGSQYKSRDKMSWVDPSKKKNYKYVLDIAKDAAKVGFDEINFDYVRFPANTSLNYSIKSCQENRLYAIESFLQQAKKELTPYGVFISVDTYGEVCWKDTDSNIGHTLASLAKYSDYIAPMLYPSGFARGTMGFKDPTDHNFDIIYRSIKNMHKDIEPARIRPWLQAFKDYAHGKKRYTKRELYDQIRATIAADTNGWMFWNPSSRYSNIGLKEMLMQVEVHSLTCKSNTNPTYNYCKR